MWNSNTVEDEIQRNSLEYGVSVNTDRSIPDAKSGLKPVARRIIYDAFIEGRTSDKPHVKCARIYGDVMGRFHPHGDSSIYGAMIRLSQDWVMRYPLIDVHGNNGTILGDGPAAGRYTEARLSKIAEDGLLQGLKKKNVDFIPNYDESEEEPVTLPAIFPNLLCNPNEGIGWAMGCSWAPHNLNEVRNAIIDYINGKEPMLPGPDFPTGGVIINANEIPDIMRTGHGTVKIRGRYRIEKQNIIFYEIPYGTRVEALMEEIGKVCDEGKITGIVDVRNETGKKDGLKLTIQVDKNNSPDSIVGQLFAKTSLQSSFSYNQVALVGKTPTEMNLKDAINIYIEHNLDCIRRETSYDLDKILNRLHIIKGLLIALEDIDNVITLIKQSESSATAKDALMKKYNLSDVQAKAIVNMKLGSLAGLEKIELNNEAAELDKESKTLKAKLENKDLQIKELIFRLDNIVKKYGDKRRTDLTTIAVAKEDKEIENIIPEDVVVILSKDGNIKRIPQSSFKRQNRNGKGVKSSSIALEVISTNTQDNLLLFSNSGKMYKVLIDNIPVGTNISGGCSIRDLTKMANDEVIIAATNIERKNKPKYVVFITAQGMIKKSLLVDYLGFKRSCIQALKLKENDSIVSIELMDEEDLILFTKNGMSIYFDTKSINAIGRVAIGVKGIILEKEDRVVASVVVKDNTNNIAIVGTNGMGKALPLDEFVLQIRNGKGIKIYPAEIADAISIANDDTLLIAGTPNSITISAADLPILKRSAAGNILIKNSTIQGIVKL